MSQRDEHILPGARIEDLVITESGNELLVYDTRTHVIHHLNPTATTIWRLLASQQTLASLQREASVILGLEVSREAAEAALSSLDSLNLLDGHIAFGAKPANPSRRRFLKRAAAVGVAVPVIASITAPAAHASGGTACGDTRVTVSECWEDYMSCWTGTPGEGNCGKCIPKNKGEWECNCSAGCEKAN